ncbi:MAG: hypothetical protein ACLR5H_10285 [Oscillospiraceae bacterium]
MIRGRIEKALSGFYYVNTGAETLQCRARGKFRREGLSPWWGTGSRSGSWAAARALWRRWSPAATPSTARRRPTSTSW